MSISVLQELHNHIQEKEEKKKNTSILSITQLSVHVC